MKFLIDKYFKFTKYNIKGRVYTILFLSYLLIIFLNFISPFPDLIKSFLALPSILFFPLNLGYLFIFIRNRLYNKKILGLTSLLSFLIICWSLGSLMILILLNILLSLGLYRLTAIIIIILSLFSVFDKGLDQLLVKKLTFKNIMFPALAGIMGILPFIYIRSFSKFPYMIGIDAFYYSQIILDIINRRTLPNFFLMFDVIMLLPTLIFNVKPLYIFWSSPLLCYIIFSISIYFFSYSLFNNVWLSLLSSSIAVWFQGSAMVNDIYINTPRILIYILFPFSLYVINHMKKQFYIKKESYLFLISFVMLLFFYISSSPPFYSSVIVYWPSVIKNLITPFYAFTEPLVFVAVSSVIFLQQLYALIITISIIFLFYLRYNFSNEKSEKMYIYFFIISLIAIMIHSIMGIVLTILLFLYFILHLLAERQRRSIILIALLFTLLFLLYVLSKNDRVSTINYYIDLIANRITIFGKRKYVFDFNWKINFLKGCYMSPVLLLSFIGLIISGKEFLNKTEKGVPPFLMFIVILFIYFLPLPFIYRILTFFTPFIAYYFSYFFLFIYNFTKHIIPSIRIIIMNKEKIIVKSKYISALFTIIILLFLYSPFLISLYQNKILYWSKLYNCNGNITIYTALDIKAAEYLKENLPYETIIISDPTTIKVLGGLIGYTYTFNGRMLISSKVSVPIIEGAYNLFKDTIKSYSYQKVLKIKRLYTESDILKGEGNFSKEVVIIVNWRTSHWIINNEDSYLNPFKRFEGFETLLTSETLKLIYNISGQYYIFKVKELNRPSLP